MATATDHITDTDNSSNPYLDKDYQQNRQAALGVISKSNFLDAISRNAGMINSTLVTTAVAGIALSASIPVWTVVALVCTALAFASFSAYAGYMNEKLSKEVGYAFGEARQRADARVIAHENAQEMAVALKDTLGEELKELKKESCQTNAAVAHLQKQMLSWQEREAAKVPAEKVLQ